MSGIKRADKRSVVLVGYQDQGNLGLGYLAAALINNGFDTHIADVKKGPDLIIQTIEEKQAILVGFSLIFQYYLPVFAKLASFLRERGVAVHFTIGGHYPSLRHNHIFDQIPELDSIVLFEGEETLVELVHHLAEGRDWRKVHGIAYRAGGEVLNTPLRPLVDDLDALPFPHRPFRPNEILGKKTGAILASRGCRRNCVFCSIREFYGRAPGKPVRRRSPANVVMEMKKLLTDSLISIFLFQDDDFPLYGREGRRWARGFIRELRNQDLAGRIIWKISCRVDEVDYDLFSELQEVGLYLVYLGIESGTDEGLKMLNKQTSIDNILGSLDVLRELGLMYGYGFMLFDPGSTFARVRQNIQFLRRIVSDNKSAAIFCKMLPYAGTPVEKNLADAGRLNGSMYHPDYDFLDPVLDGYAAKVDETLGHWVRGGESVSHHFNMAWHETAILRNFFPEVEGLPGYEKKLQSLTRTSNEVVFSVLESYASEFERGEMLSSPPETWSEAKKLVGSLLDLRNAFIYENQPKILAGLSI